MRDRKAGTIAKKSEDAKVDWKNLSLQEKETFKQKAKQERDQGMNVEEEETNFSTSNKISSDVLRSNRKSEKKIFFYVSF